MIKKLNKSSFDTGAFDFECINKKYYQEKENYDWVSVTDNIQGLESFFHRLREKGTVALIKKFGRGGEYLDAGCGTGLILRHCPKNSVGLDINPRNIEKARKYLPEAKLVLGDIENIPLNDNFFSTVICTEVFEHLPEPKTALAEALRVLKKGGVLIGTVPRLNPIWRLRIFSSTHPGEPYHKEYRKNDLLAFLSGQKIIHIKSMNFCLSWAFVVEK